jgi:hypothetical protein
MVADPDTARKVKMTHKREILTFVDKKNKSWKEECWRLLLGLRNASWLF